MKAKDKPKYVEEARKLFESLDINLLITDPNNLQEIKKINRLIAIFTNFSYNDGQELRNLFLDFQRWARQSTRVNHIKNRVSDMMQFIGQKIEEMDLYEIEEPIKAKQDKIVKSLKDEKLWVRSSLEGKDLHVLIGERNAKAGEHVHLISDSETGEIRIDDEDKTPNELIERVVSITTKQGSAIGVSQYGVKTTMEFFDKDVINANKDIPILYATRIRTSGGASGHFEYITIKNIGKEIALDVHWGIRGFAYEWRPTEEGFEIEPNHEKEVKYPISNEKTFRESIQELNVIMEYKDSSSKAYLTRRELRQERVPSGEFYNLKLETFHPPSLLIDDGLDLLSGPTQNGDRDEADFAIHTKEGRKTVKIGISRTLLSMWGFSDEAQIKQALLELGHRKIRKMVREGNLRDHIFTTYDCPEGERSMFEGYVRLRDSL